MSDGNSENLPLSPTILTLLGLGVFASGGGVVSVIQPGMERASLQACFDNSQTAIRMVEGLVQVEADHGTELQIVRERFEELRRHVNDLTEDRYRSRDARDDQAAHARVHDSHEDAHDLINRRLDFVEDHFESGE